MFEKLIQTQVQKFLKPEMVSMVLKGMVQKAKEYKDSVKLESDEKTVAGIIILAGDRFIVSPCAMRISERGKLEVSRSLRHYTDEELAELLVKNIGKADLSSIL